MFKFSLQTVLEVRERFERIKYKEYSAELLVQQGLEDQMDQRREALQQSGRRVDERMSQSPSAIPMQWHADFRRRLLEEIGMMEDQVRDQRELVEAKRRELVEARRSHRALEILRDKEYKRYLEREQRLERGVMDEVAANYHQYQR